MERLEEAMERFHPTSLRELKLCTRIGMGICQGRVCRPLAEALALRWDLASGPDQLALRGPLRPTRLGNLADAPEDDA